MKISYTITKTYLRTGQCYHQCVSTHYNLTTSVAFFLHQLGFKQQHRGGVRAIPVEDDKVASMNPRLCCTWPFSWYSLEHIVFSSAPQRMAL